MHPGQASTALMDALCRRFTPDSLCDTLAAGLEAMTPPIVTKAGEVLSKPDYATRLRYLELAFAYQVGRPIERQMVIQSSPPATLEDLMEKARASPVFRKTLLDLLSSLEG